MEKIYCPTLLCTDEQSSREIDSIFRRLYSSPHLGIGGSVTLTGMISLKRERYARHRHVHVLPIISVHIEHRIANRESDSKGRCCQEPDHPDEITLTLRTEHGDVKIICYGDNYRIGTTGITGLPPEESNLELDGVSLVR